MKIALISTEKLPVPAIAGGAVQLYIESILPYLVKHHQITVFGVAYPSLPQDEERDGVRYIRVPAKDGNEYLNNIKKVLTHDFDLVHVFNRPVWVAELSSAFPDTKFSLSLHNEMFSTKKISAAKAKECITKVEFINTVSKFIADGVSYLYPEAENKLTVVYSGADTKIYKPNWTDEAAADRNRLKTKYNIRGCRVILFIGRLSVKKGVHVLLKAMKTVMDKNPDAALVIIGSKWYGENKSDEYTKSLEVLSKSLPGPVVLTGFIPPSEVISHYNLGDIFVCPSQWNEPLARVHYEAMAAGLPIITTNRGGNAEVISVRENGLVVDDYSNPDALADNICYLLDNPAVIRNMGKAGRALAEKMYDWERVAKDLLTLFNRVEENHGVTLQVNNENLSETLPEDLRSETALKSKTEEKTSQTKTHDKGSPCKKEKCKPINYSLYSEAYRVHLLGCTTHTESYRNALRKWD